MNAADLREAYLRLLPHGDYIGGVSISDDLGTAKIRVAISSSPIVDRRTWLAVIEVQAVTLEQADAKIRQILGGHNG